MSFHLYKSLSHLLGQSFHLDNGKWPFLVLALFLPKTFMTNCLRQRVLHIKARGNYFFQSTNAVEKVKGVVDKI